MKRSTLTLSILTALLVSACGGSSSNDEQTKDPTPPKVTPTNPSTPSTGRTPTTGKKEQPKKEEASSSSSSDSTPPISSGNAPSGGKPIVIAGEGKKEIKPDPKPDEGKGKEKTDEEKKDEQKGDQESADLAAAKEKADKSAEALKLAKQNTVAKTAVAQAAEENLKTILAEIKEIHTQFDLDGLPEKALTAADTEAAAGKEDEAKKIRDLYDKYVKDKADAESLRADAENAAKAEEEAAAEAAKDAEDVALKQIDEKWKDKPDVQSVKDVVAAEKANTKAQNKKKSLEDESTQLESRKTALGDESSGEIKKAKEELEALENLLKDATTPETKEKIKTAIKKKTEELKAKKDEAADVANKLGHVEADKTTATATANETKTDLENKAKIAKNFGVAGKTGLTNSVFTGVQKAEKTGTEWKITFAGEKEGIVVNPTFTGDVAGNATDYGKFGLINGKNSAYKASENSIYGYFGDKFYSAGEATDPKVLAKITPDKIGDFAGHSLLQKPDGSYLVSNVVGKIHFDDSKEFRGNFNSFKAVKGTTVSDIEEGRLGKGKSVGFTAIVDKNTFKPATKTEAKVYGYFYGTEGKEAGGLVEFENEFHGSFGGAVEIK